MALLGHLEFRLCAWVVRQADNTRGSNYFRSFHEPLASRRSLSLTLTGSSPPGSRNKRVAIIDRRRTAQSGSWCGGSSHGLAASLSMAVDGSSPSRGPTQHLMIAARVVQQPTRLQVSLSFHEPWPPGAFVFDICWVVITARVTQQLVSQIVHVHLVTIRTTRMSLYIISVY